MSVLLDVRKAAEFLNVKESWIRNKVFTKQIPHLKVGRHIRFDQAAIQNWLEKHTVQEGGQL